MMNTRNEIRSIAQVTSSMAEFFPHNRIWQIAFGKLELIL